MSSLIPISHPSLSSRHARNRALKIILVILSLLIILFLGGRVFQWWYSQKGEVPFNCETCEVLPASCGLNFEQGVVLEGKISSAKIVTLTYNTPLKNRPKTNGDWLGIWEGTSIDYGNSPIYRQKIPLNKRCGSLALDTVAFQVGKSYIIAYGVGTDSTSIASTLLYPWQFATGTSGLPARTKIRPIEIGCGYVVIEYCTPEGNQPEKFKNWVAIRKGHTFQYENDRFKQHFIKGNYHQGRLALNDTAIRPEGWYTLMYGTGPKPQEISAAWTFKGAQVASCCPDPCRKTSSTCSGCIPQPTLRNYE